MATPSGSRKPLKTMVISIRGLVTKSRGNVRKEVGQLLNWLKERTNPMRKHKNIISSIRQGIF